MKTKKCYETHKKCNGTFCNYSKTKKRKPKIKLVSNEDRTWQFIDCSVEGAVNLTSPIPETVFMDRLTLAELRDLSSGKISSVKMLYNRFLDFNL